MSFLERVPALWGGDENKVWLAMRYTVAPTTLFLAPSYGYGAERIPPGGALIAANHFSGIDHPLIAAFVPRPVPFMAKAELMDIPFVGEVLRWTGTFSVRRGEGDRAAVYRAREIVREGGLVCIHVEGTRQRLGYPGPIQLGALSIAIMEHVPVIPCAVNTFGWTPFNRRRCAVVYGEPISLEGVPRGKAGYAEAADLVETEIVRLWRQAIGAVDAGFPLQLDDGARRNDVAAPGWRPPRDPARVVQH